MDIRSGAPPIALLGTVPVHCQPTPFTVACFTGPLSPNWTVTPRSLLIGQAESFSATDPVTRTLSPTSALACGVMILTESVIAILISFCLSCTGDWSRDKRHG